MMSFNSSKWKVIHITKKRNPIIYTYKVHQSTLQSVKSGKYLGVNISHGIYTQNLLSRRPTTPYNSL
jgi:hypothetical protein